MWFRRTQASKQIIMFFFYNFATTTATQQKIYINYIFFDLVSLLIISQIFFSFLLLIRHFIVVR